MTKFSAGQHVQITKGRNKGVFGVVDKIRSKRPYPYYIAIRGSVLVYSAHELRAA